MSVNSKSATTFVLGLSEIAAWQTKLDDVVLDDQKQSNRHIDPLIVQLPALQRGSVWKVRQIEELWDSVLRGFPIGSFMVCPHDSHLGSQRFKLQTAVNQSPTHFLLDGQQRATGIALGFYDAWSVADTKDVKSVLWVDICAPKIRDIDFMFRVITRAHPWGYSQSDPSERLTAHQMRSALSAYKQADATTKDLRADQIDLTSVWPWDAVAPIPMSFLLTATVAAQGDINSTKIELVNRLKKLPFVAASAPPEETKWCAQKNNVLNALNLKSEPSDSRELDLLISRIWDRYCNYGVPISVVPSLDLISVNEKELNNNSSIETLFVRINSAGTPLQGEELIYSLIKARWTDAPQEIEKLTHKIVTPVRVALLATRLVKAFEPLSNYVQTPTVEVFRRWMSNSKYINDIKSFIETDGLALFDSARKFLVVEKFGLPVFLACEIAQQSQDVFFILLCWLKKCKDLGVDTNHFDENSHKRALAFITTIAWFSDTAEAKNRCCIILYKELMKCVDQKTIVAFFERENFSKIKKIDSKNRINTPPIVHPLLLKSYFERIILGKQRCSNTITTENSDIWKNWQWYENLVLPSELDVADFKSSSVSDQSPEEIKDLARQGWHQFLDKLWGCRPMLLYAQREWMAKWFPNFDPSLPEFLEDKNRPWDFDHIHAQSYLQGSSQKRARHGIPKIIKDWHSSIGNLRAWPLEINRSDGDKSPHKKFDEINDVESNHYLIKTIKDKKAASFINDENLTDWHDTTSSDGQLTDHTERRALMQAIVSRFLKIYEHWYSTFKLNTLN